MPPKNKKRNRQESQLKQLEKDLHTSSVEEVVNYFDGYVEEIEISLISDSKFQVNALENEIEGIKAGSAHEKSLTSLEFEKLTIREIRQRLECKCKDFKKQKVVGLQKLDALEKITSPRLMVEIRNEISRFRLTEADIRNERRRLRKCHERVMKKCKLVNYCNLYLPIKEFAVYFVDSIIKDALASIREPSDDDFIKIKMKFYETKKVQLLKMGLSPNMVEKVLDCYTDDDIKEALYRGRDLDENLVHMIADQLKDEPDLIDSFSSLSGSSNDSINYKKEFCTKIAPLEGLQLVENEVKNWKVRKYWMYCIDFLGEKCDTCYDYYEYEVKWNKTNKMFPVPQVTASVFFIIEKPRIKPLKFPIKVKYRFESNKYFFDINDKIKQEAFLEDIVNSKINLYKKIRF